MGEKLQEERFLWEQDEADRQLLWERYENLCSETIDYLRIVINFTIFFYGISGAIISFVLSEAAPPVSSLALWLPALMGIGSGLAYLYFGWSSNLGNEELERIANKLFGYTKREIRIMEYLNNQEPYKSLPEEEREKRFKDEYGIDGSYMYRNQTALQAALFILGVLHLGIGGFCIWLSCYYTG